MKWRVLYRVISHEMEDVEAPTRAEAKIVVEQRAMKRAVETDGCWDVEVDRIYPLEMESR
jgi:hypothetical protein